MKGCQTHFSIPSSTTLLPLSWSQFGVPRKDMDVASGLLILLLVAPAVYAMDYTVGDTAGWNVGVDFQAWASAHTFYAGDNLLFQYGPTHSVDIVSSSNYESCTTAKPLQTYKSGNDTITLNSAGSMYFICPTTYHCNQGMKLAVTVLASNSTPATPTASSPSSTHTHANSSPPPNLCNINALVLGLGVSLFFYALMG